MLAWMAFQWGPGNDVVLPPLVATVFDGVDDGETWRSGVASVLLSTAAAFGFWSASQFLDAVIVTSGLGLVPGLTERIARFINRKGWAIPYERMRWSTRWIVAYAAGPSVICLADVFSTGRPGLRGRWSMIVASVVLSAGSVAIVVAAITTATLIGRRIPATAASADLLIRVAKNPLVWIAIFALVYGIDWFRSRRSD